MSHLTDEQAIARLTETLPALPRWCGTLLTNCVSSMPGARTL